MSEIKWQRGTYLKFVANIKIRVGGGAPLDIQKEDEFEFDGSILKYSGLEIPQSQMRGAISSGWARLVGSEEMGVDSIRPNRNMAKAQTVNTDLNRVQRTVNSQISTNSYDEDEILRVGDRSDTDAKAPKIITASDNRKGRVQADVGDSQDAVAIGRVRTSARTVSDVSKDDTKKKISELENLSNIKADLYKTTEKEGITIKSNVGNVNRIGSTSEGDEGRVIGSVRKATKVSTEGLSVEDTSNIRTKVKPEVTEVVEEEVGYVPAATDRSLPVRVRLARSIDPSFPSDWSFDGKLADRLAAIQASDRSEAFLEALYAAEGDQMRKVLTKEYPHLFA